MSEPAQPDIDGAAKILDTLEGLTLGEGVSERGFRAAIDRACEPLWARIAELEMLLAGRTDEVRRANEGRRKAEARIAELEQDAAEARQAWQNALARLVDAEARVKELEKQRDEWEEVIKTSRRVEDAWRSQAIQTEARVAELQIELGSLEGSALVARDSRIIALDKRVRELEGLHLHHAPEWEKVAVTERQLAAYRAFVSAFKEWHKADHTDLTEIRHHVEQWNAAVDAEREARGRMLDAHRKVEEVDP